MKPLRAPFLVTILVVGALIALAVGCAGPAPAPAPAQPREYTGADSRIEAKAGDEFVVALESNITTGYKWDLAGPMNEAVVKAMGWQYVAPGTGRPGQGGVER